jgi:hypothetical protein
LNGILEILPEYVIYGFYAVVTFVAVMIFLSIWKNISPAAPGIPLGYYEILGRYAGGNLMKRIQGTLVDATQIFLNPEVEPKFKKYIIRNLEASSKGNPGSELQALKTAFSRYPLGNACRIIVTRDRFWTKHVMIQWGYVDKPLTEYAMHEERGKFTFSAGLISRGVITGAIKTLPDPWEIPKLGKCRVHLFLPDAGRGEHFTAPPSWLAKIALYTPSVVEMSELMESKDEMIRDLHRQVSDLSRMVAGAATGRDAFIKILSIFSTEGKPPEEIESMIRPFSMGDAVKIGIPAAIGAYLANYYGYEWFYGAIAGLATGYFLYRYFRGRRLPTA